jgi:ubiquinone/menaquinone biosynthesis C-methylase UbiE
VRQLADQATLLDLCCATGQHLISFTNRMKYGIGVDFSLPYLQKAHANKTSGNNNHTHFVCGDVKTLPFQMHYFDLVYSFSSLYQIPNVGDVLHEISRVLKPGSKCILDLGNLYSLNLIVSKAHPELPQPCYIPVGTMKRLLQEAGLVITEHRAFQILPMWADRPKWLKPLLWPGWKRLLEKQIKGKMLDEWISNLPGLKFFAFRHVFVCEKKDEGAPTA